MMFEWIRQIDTSLFLFLNRDCRNGVFDVIMPFITSRSYLLILPFLIPLLIKEKKKAFALLVVSLFSVLLADGTSNALKHLLARERPCNVLENVHLLVGCTKSFSMPSNHAANAFAFAVPLLLMTSGRLKYSFLAIAVLVAVSRVSVGVHYPTDVIVGGALGFLLSAGLVYLHQWSAKRFKARPLSTVMFLFLVALSLFRIYYILFGPLDLSPDEAHYWEWARRLDLSYYSKGPMIAYLIALGTALFGDTVFGVRILAVVFSALSSVLLYRLGREMYGETAGAASAMLLQIIPLYAPFGVIFTIDSPFIFFWTLSLFLFWKAVTSDKSRVTSKEQNADSSVSSRYSSLVTRYWLLLGVSVGLGLLTKYTMVFFYICGLLFLLLPAQNRRLLKTAGPYISLVISAIIFSPVIIWNVRHDWVTVRHTAGQAHVAEGLHISLKSFFEFIGSQVGVLTPVLFVMIAIALWRIRGTQSVIARSEATKQSHISEIASPSARNDVAENRGAFLFWFAIPVVGFFLIKSLQGKVQANWAMTGYITGITAFSACFIARWESLKSSAKTTIVVGIALSLFVSTVAYYPSAFRIPVKLDPSSRLRGWKELGKEVSAMYSELSKREKVFLFSDSYQASSELAFYVEGRPVTYCINLGRRMNQYDLWPGFHDFIHYQGIFVTIGDTELHPRVRSAFHRCEKRLLRVDERGRPLRDYSLFICHDFKGMEKAAIRSY